MVTKSNVVVAVQSTIPAVDAFDAVIAEQSADIVKSAEMMVSVEKLEGDVVDKKAGISSLLYGVLISQGEPVTHAWHEVVRLQWGDAYRANKGGALTDTAIDTAWSRVYKLVSDAYGLTKPKAETKDAERKAKERAELLVAYEDFSIDELKAKAKDLINKSDNIVTGKQAKQEANKVIKAIEARSRDQNAKMKAELKDVKKQIADTLKQVDDILVLHDVLEMLEGSVDDAENLL